MILISKLGVEALKDPRQLDDLTWDDKLILRRFSMAPVTWNRFYFFTIPQNVESVDVMELQELVIISDLLEESLLESTHG